MIKRPEELNKRERAELIMDMIHRIAVHHTLWFREVEHQLGFEEAMKAMSEAYERTKDISLKRLSKDAGLKLTEDMPSAFMDISDDEQLKLMDIISKNWLAMDGVWFQAVEKEHGMNDAKRCNDSTWGRFSPFEALSVKKLLGMTEHPGLEGLKTAFAYRLYGRLNDQTCELIGGDDEKLVLKMTNCRVQAARQKKGLEDYPCKSAGLVEYERFAKAIDSRIKTRCIGCPPDEHPSDWHCAWEFYIG